MAENSAINRWLHWSTNSYLICIFRTGCFTTDYTLKYNCFTIVLQLIETLPGQQLNARSVFEINGALGAQRAHFRGRAHVFRTCAPDVRTFIHPIIIAIYQRSAQKNPGRIAKKCMHPTSAQNKMLISNTADVCQSSLIKICVV